MIYLQIVCMNETVTQKTQITIFKSYLNQPPKDY